MAGPLEFVTFTPLNNGVGVALSCTGTSSRAALPALSPDADTLAITNCGTDIAFIALGDGSITATTASMAVPPGTYFVQLPNAGGSAAPSYIAGITAGTAVTVQASVGNSVV